MLFEHGTITQVIEQRDAGVVDEDVKRLDLPGRVLNLRGAGHVQGQGRDPLVGAGQGLARAGIHPPGTSAEGFFD